MGDTFRLLSDCFQIAFRLLGPYKKWDKDQLADYHQIALRPLRVAGTLKKMGWVTLSDCFQTAFRLLSDCP